MICSSCGNPLTGKLDEHDQLCPLCPERQRLIQLLCDWLEDEQDEFTEIVAPVEPATSKLPPSLLAKLSKRSSGS